MKLTSDFIWCYTFHLHDASNGSVDISLADGNINTNTIGNWDEDGKMHLNNFIFCIYTTSASYAIYNNIFGPECFYITIAQNAVNNTCEGRMMRTCIGANASGNTIGETTAFIAEKNFKNNRLTAQSHSCIFGEYNGNNEFHGQNIVTGTYFSDNILLSTCLYCTFGNYVQRNVMYTIQYCEIENYFQYNYLFKVWYLIVDKDYFSHNIIEQNDYLTITSTQTTSAAAPLRFIKICQGVGRGKAEAGRVTISHDTVNDDFQTEYKPVNSVIVNV